MNSTTGLTLGFAGSILLGTLGILIIKKYSRLKKTGIKVKGEVIDIIKNSSYQTNQTPDYTLVIKFETEDKETITVKLGFNVDKYAYQIGQSLPLYYDPGNPEQFMIDDSRSNFIGPFMLTMAIAGFILCVVLSFVFANK